MSERVKSAGQTVVDIKLCQTGAFVGDRETLRADYQAFDAAATLGAIQDSYPEEFQTRTVAEIIKGA